jgi:hypothetical protein
MVVRRNFEFFGHRLGRDRGVGSDGAAATVTRLPMAIIYKTCIKVRDGWKYLYRAVDRDGETVDFLLTARRDEPGARRFLEQAIDCRGRPETITIEKGGATSSPSFSFKTSTMTADRRTAKLLPHLATCMTTLLDIRI